MPIVKQDSSDIIRHALAAPYTRVFRKQEDGGYQALVLELPGVMTAGERIEETNEFLDEAMALWIEAEVAAGHEIPEPIDPEKFSGRLTLRIPPTLHYRAQLLAELFDISLNRVLTDAIAESVGAWSARASTSRQTLLQDLSFLLSHPSTADARVEGLVHGTAPIEFSQHLEDLASFGQVLQQSLGNEQTRELLRTTLARITADVATRPVAGTRVP